MGDGIIQSRFKRHRNTPLGKDFAYTDAMDLKVNGKRAPWYKRWRKPFAWVVVDGESTPSAYIMHNGEGEIRTSAVDARALIKVYDDRLIIAAGEHVEQDDGDG